MLVRLVDFVHCLLNRHMINKLEYYFNLKLIMLVRNSLGPGENNFWTGTGYMFLQLAQRACFRKVILGPCFRLQPKSTSLKRITSSSPCLSDSLNSLFTQCAKKAMFDRPVRAFFADCIKHKFNEFWFIS